MNVIRAHTKTDDTPAVLDEQLRMYRASAVEAAEQYAGLLLSGIRNVTEPIEGPTKTRPGRDWYTFRLKYPVSDGFVYLYGGTHPGDNATFRVPLGARKIKVPVRKDFIDLSN